MELHVAGSLSFECLTLASRARILRVERSDLIIELDDLLLQHLARRQVLLHEPLASKVHERLGIGVRRSTGILRGGARRGERQHVCIGIGAHGEAGPAHRFDRRLSHCCPLGQAQLVLETPGVRDAHRSLEGRCGGGLQNQDLGRCPVARGGEKRIGEGCTSHSNDNENDHPAAPPDHLEVATEVRRLEAAVAFHSSNSMPSRLSFQTTGDIHPQNLETSAMRNRTGEGRKSSSTPTPVRARFGSPERPVTPERMSPGISGSPALLHHAAALVGWVTWGRSAGTVDVTRQNRGESEPACISPLSEVPDSLAPVSPSIAIRELLGPVGEVVESAPVIEKRAPRLWDLQQAGGSNDLASVPTEWKPVTNTTAGLAADIAWARGDSGAQ